jgi:ATP-binding cassette subfamily B protein
VPWRDRLAALRHVPALLRLVWGAHRGYAAAVAVLRLVRAGVPVLTLWVGKLIIDEVLAAAQTAGADTGRLWRLVALEIGVVVGGDLLARASALLESLLGDRFANVTSVRLMEHAATLDLAQFEDPAFYDQLERARRQTTGAWGCSRSSRHGAGRAHPRVARRDARRVRRAAARAARRVGDPGRARRGALRRARLLAALPLDARAPPARLPALRGRERPHGQGGAALRARPWLVARYRTLADRFDADNRRLAVRRAGVGAALGLVGTVGYYAAYALVLAPRRPGGCR